MFGIESDLIRYLVALGVGTALTAAIITWVMARRHGWKAALLVPLAIFLGAVGMVWRITGQGGGANLDLIAMASVLAAPGIVGALIALLIAARRR